MRTPEHQAHLDSRTCHADCPECRADSERRFVPASPWRYDHVHDYLAYVKPLMSLIQAGDTSATAKEWLRKFRRALDTRITLKAPPQGRKYCDSYLDRLRQFPRSTDAAYLRRFASRGASCLDYR